MSTEQVALRKKTAGQIFKEKHGYSKTTKRLMQKYDVTTLEEYKEIKKEARHVRAADKKKRHQKIIAGRRTKAEMTARRAARKKK